MLDVLVPDDDEVVAVAGVLVAFASDDARNVKAGVGRLLPETLFDVLSVDEVEVVALA